MPNDTETVLVVDDEAAVAETYRRILDDHYDVRVASNGREALEQLTDAVSVVLLDRRMPDRSGDEVLSRIRTRGFSCRVAMVTAVEPTIDTVEMGFDSYLVKPVSEAELLGTVAELVRRQSYDATLQQYYSLVSKAALLRERNTEQELASNDVYRKLQQRIEFLEEQLDEAVLELPDDAAFEASTGPDRIR